MDTSHVQDWDLAVDKLKANRSSMIENAKTSNLVYRVGQKNRSYFVLRLVTSEILIRSASKLASIKFSAPMTWPFYS